MSGQDNLPGRQPSVVRGTRRRRWLRLVLLALSIGIISSVALRLAAPHLISSSLVRSAIGSAIAEWTGHDVEIADVPEVTFWPEPQVTLTGVIVSRSGGGDREVLGEIDSLTASFSFYSALRGQPNFSEFRFVRPRIRVERDGNGRLDWSNEGLLSEAVRAARPGTDGSGQQIGSEFDTDVGTIDVVDGEIMLVDARSGQTLTVGGLNAEIAWPKLSAPLSGTASLVVNETAMTLSLQTGAPLLLIGGQDAAVSATATMAGMTARADGTMNLHSGFVGSSAVEIGVTDVPKIAAITGLRLAGTESWQTASIKTRLVSVVDEWRLEDLTFQINERRGNGAVAMKRMPGARYMLSGTLALDHLELDDLLQSLSIDLGDEADVRLPSLTRWIDFDMRLSAATAAFPPFNLTDVGASLIGHGDSLKLVIADSGFLGGSLSTRISGSGAGFDRGADLAVSIEKARLGDLFSGLGLQGPALIGTGSINLNARLTGTGWQRNMETMSGTLKIAADNGRLEGFDPDGIRRLSRDNSYFQLSAAGDGSLDFQQFDLAARFADGSAEVEKARFVGKDETLILSGIAPFSRQALALTGELRTVDAGETADANAEPLRFFIGGAWGDPVISPIPPSIRANQ